MRSLALALCLAFVVGAYGARDPSMRSLAQAGNCQDGEFYKPWDNSCMACDPYCNSTCVTKDGCPACVKGYYTSRMDPEWPNECKLCTIANCVTCRSGIYDAWPMQCDECASGYELVDNKKSCAPIGGGSVQGDSVTRPTVEESGTPVPNGAIYPETDPTSSAPMVLPPGYVMPQPIPASTPDVASGTPMMDMVLPPGYVMPSPRPDVEPSIPVKTYPVPEPKPVAVPAPVPVPVPAAVPVPVPVPVPAVEPAKPKPDVSPETISQGPCPEKSFVKMDGTCMECDEFCLPEKCADRTGCAKCQDGYFTQAEDPEWPNVCVLCDLPNCVKCVDNSYTAWDTFCEVCATGYELASDRKCVAVGGNVGGESLEKGEEYPTPPATYPKEEPAATGDEIVLAPGVCHKDHFLKEHDGTCMKCDKNCETGSCVDYAGCNKCKPKYYRSRRDLSWPFLCVQCSAVIPGCEVCEDGMFDQQLPDCLACFNNKAPVDGKCLA